MTDWHSSDTMTDKKGGDFMAHCQKFSRGSASRIIGHCEREKSEHGEYLKYRTSSNIDTSRTHMNMPMNFKDGLTAQQRFEKRLQEVHVLNRKDVNVLCDWVVTMPEGLSQDNNTLRNFFGETVKFLNARYGSENVVSCNIHMDEAQPHLHYCFVPVVYDKKKERHKVSAKEVLTRADLNSFHRDLENHLHESIGLEKGLVYSGKTEMQGGNKTIGQLKAESIEKAAEASISDLQAYEAEINASIEKIKSSDDWKSIEFRGYEYKDYKIPVTQWFKDSELKIKKGKVTMPVEELNSLFKAVLCLKAQNRVHDTLKTLKNEIRALYAYDPEVVQARFEQVQQKEQAANNLYQKQLTLNERFESLESRIKSIEKENAGLQVIEKDYETLKDNYESLAKTYKKTKLQLQEVTKTLKSYDDMFKRLPDLAEEIKQQYHEQIKLEKTAAKPKKKDKGYDFER